ncbi:MAG: hypothetical protein HKN61_03135 [Flavobacteriaceae bacterium]|nr:hypothetical protein [Flavobacteriaceae bacterium]
MKKLRYRLVSLVIILAFYSCNTGPRPIDYGTDKCQYCSMTIVDLQRAAQIVSSKGKIYSFDAVECMIHYSLEKDMKGNSYFCNSFDQPGKLMDVNSGTFLIAKSLPSPMGAFLTPFENAAEADKLSEIHPGDIFNWVSLREHFKSGM